jgi:hypothetical protein
MEPTEWKGVARFYKSNPRRWLEPMARASHKFQIGLGNARNYIGLASLEIVAGDIFASERLT